MKRFNKEYNLTKYGSIQMKLGTINKDDPKVIYVSGRCWLTPRVEINYKEAFEEIKKNVNKKVKSVIADDDRFSNKFINDTSISLSVVLIFP